MKCLKIELEVKRSSNMSSKTNVFLLRWHYSNNWLHQEQSFAMTRWLHIEQQMKYSQYYLSQIFSRLKKGCSSVGWNQSQRNKEIKPVFFSNILFIL